MRVTSFLACMMIPALALAEGMPADGGQPPSEVPSDMPPPPSEAPPVEAPPVGATADRPPHPETPDPLAEAEPSALTLASTQYHWLPGHWIWTGEHFEWRSGMWIYAVRGYALVPPRWQWDGAQWVFHNAGWALPGTDDVVFAPTPAPEVNDNPGEPPLRSDEWIDPTPATTTVFVSMGVYTPPLIMYPMWHPYYHYWWYRGYPLYARQPLYRHPRYYYSRRYAPPLRPRGRPPGVRPPGGGRPPDVRPPSGRPPQARPPMVGRPPQARPPTTGRPPQARPPTTGRPPQARPPTMSRPPQPRQPTMGRPPSRSSTRPVQPSRPTMRQSPSRSRSSGMPSRGGMYPRRREHATDGRDAARRWHAARWWHVTRRPPWLTLHWLARAPNLTVAG